jgi:hypothetical protein
VTNPASDEMHIPPPRKEWNINTIISVAGFFLTLAGGVYAYGQLTSQVAYTEEQLAAYKTATDLRVAAIELSTRQIDALAFRLTAAESTNATISKGLADLQAAVSQQSGDIRVVREILQRIERQAAPATFSPMASTQ